jgi:hypothetical protein
MSDTDEQDNPPQRPKGGDDRVPVVRNVAEYAALYAVGLVAGLIFTPVAFIGIGGAFSVALRIPPLLLAFMCFVVLALAIAAKRGLGRRKDTWYEPIFMGLLTGICIIALLMGVCFGLIGLN